MLKSLIIWVVAPLILLAVFAFLKAFSWVLIGAVAIAGLLTMLISPLRKGK